MGAAATGLFHLPVVSSRFDLAPGDGGDARGVVFLLEHWRRSLTGSAELASPAMFHPVSGTLGYSEALLAHAIPFSLFRSAGLDLFSGFQITLLLFGFLNWLACFALLHRGLSIGVWPACAGALFYAFNGPKLAQVVHPQLQALFLLPLALLLVVAWARWATGSTRGSRGAPLLPAAAAVLSLQFYTAFYPGWFFVFWCLLFLGVALLVPATRAVAVRVARRHRRDLLVGGASFVVLMIPFWTLYSGPLDEFGGWSWSYVRPLMPEWRSLVLPSERNYVWGGLATAMTAADPPPTNVEHRMAIGLVASSTWIAVSLYAIHVLIRRRPPPGSVPPPRVLLAVLVVSADLMLLLGLPWPGGFSPWQVVHSIVPGAQAIRVVSRSILVLALPMAIAFAYLLHRITARAERLERPARIALLGGVSLLVALGFLEQLGRHATFGIDAERSRLRRLSARLPEGCSSFYAVPGRRPAGVKYEDQIDAMLVAVTKGVPTLNGYTGHVPRGWRLRETEAADYEERVAEWIADRRVTGRVCRLEIGA